MMYFLCNNSPSVPFMKLLMTQKHVAHKISAAINLLTGWMENVKHLLHQKLLIFQQTARENSNTYQPDITVVGQRI